eukprot:3358271-Pyramimonas_sp.AAC.1
MGSHQKYKESTGGSNLGPLVVFRLSVEAQATTTRLLLRSATLDPRELINDEPKWPKLYS